MLICESNKHSILFRERPGPVFIQFYRIDKDTVRTGGFGNADMNSDEVKRLVAWLTGGDDE